MQVVNIEEIKNDRILHLIKKYNIDEVIYLDDNEFFRVYNPYLSLQKSSRVKKKLVINGYDYLTIDMFIENGREKNYLECASGDWKITSDDCLFLITKKGLK